MLKTHHPQGSGAVGEDVLAGSGCESCSGDSGVGVEERELVGNRHGEYGSGIA